MAIKKDTKQTIIDKAKKIFAQKGYESASMADIAESAGVEKASLYYFFRNKEELFAAITEQNWNELAKKLRNDAALSPESITKETFAEYIVHIIKKNLKAGLAVLDFNVCSAASPHCFAKATAHQLYMKKRMREFFKKIGISDIDTAESVIVSGIQGYIIQSQMHKPMVSPERFGRYLTDVILNKK